MARRDQVLSLEAAERVMQLCWYRLVMAEQQGQPVEVLERLFQAYQRAVEAFVSLAEQGEACLVS
jgi:hypothetical protein